MKLLVLIALRFAWGVGLTALLVALLLWWTAAMDVDWRVLITWNEFGEARFEGIVLHVGTVIYIGQGLAWMLRRR